MGQDLVNLRESRPDALRWSEPYRADRVYYRNNLVSYLSVVWRLKAGEVTGVAPPASPSLPSSVWDLFAVQSATGGDLSADAIVGLLDTYFGDTAWRDDTDLAVANRGTETLDITSSTGNDATIPKATGSLAGLLISADKTKLDAVEDGAEANVGTDLSVDNRDGDSLDVLSSTGADATIPAATTSFAGLLTAADKTKLDGIEAGADNNVGTDLDIANQDDDSLDITSSTGASVTIPAATTDLAGLMSADDKEKLDGLTEGGGSATDLGLGVEDDESIEITSSTGASVTLEGATDSLAGLLIATDKVKLDGIAAGAEVNVQADWTEADTGSDAYILHKPTLGTAAALAADTDGTLAANSDARLATQKAVKTYVDTAIADVGGGGGGGGGNTKVRAAAPGNVTISTGLNNGDSLDGVTLVTDDLVFLPNQDAPEENGIYKVGVTPVRMTGYTTFDVFPGLIIVVEEGAQYHDTIWLCTSDPGDTIDADPLEFAEIPSVADKVKLDTLDFTTLSIDNRDGDTLDIVADSGETHGVTIPAVTTSLSGLMTADDKTKLDGIEDGAEVNIGTDLSIANRGVSTLDVASSTGADATIPAATTMLTGLQTAADKTKLDGIEAGAQVNVQADWAQGSSGADSYIRNKPTLGTASTLDFDDDPTLAADSDALIATQAAVKAYIDDAIAGVGGTDLGLDNVTGTTIDITSSTGDAVTLPAATGTDAGLLTATDKTKLDGIEDGAEVNVATDLSVTNRTGSALDIASSTGTDATVPAADGSNAGLMTATQFTKLAGIETGANLYTSEMAQDAVGGILTDSTTIDFTYDDGGNTITAIVKDASISLAKWAAGILDTDGTLAANDDGKVASQKAGKTYADTHLAGLAISLADPGADRITFWDDSASQFAHLTLLGGAVINGTNLRIMESFIISLSDESTPLTTGTAKVTFRIPYAFTITSIRASVNTASSTAGPVTVDIKEAGTTIFSTKLTIDDTEKTSVTAATPAVISDANFADDAEITFNIDTAGTGAKGLKIVIIGFQP